MVIRKDMRNKKVFFILQAGIIAALYAAITLVLAPISYGPIMQVRVSEILTVLPALTPAAIPGLFIGCAIANLLGPFGIADMIFGSSATLLAALGSYLLRTKPLLVPLPPVIANAIIIGAELVYVYAIPLPMYVVCGWVGLGELIACYVLGYPLLRYMMRHRHIFDLNNR